ncbi:hypothetical protein ACQP1K_17220 [Sphaerimonospora sp. CA-214678]|uniref:hypothetical protein n=1 Tax=Sphaerimonospora sp. CA-214678 TaxID=3240029 RepID=UPI003D8ED4F7
MISRIVFTVALVAAGLGSAATGAQAAVPDRWGFALVDVPSGVPNLTYQAGSWPGGFNVTVAPGGMIGQTYVTFPQIASRRGVVHVTAVSDAPVWCQIQKWGPSGLDQVAVVQCYHYGGQPTFTPFSIVFAESSGVLPLWSETFGTVFWNGSSIGSQYNSMGAVNTVVPTGAGQWLVTLPGLGSATAAGNVQVTAVDSNRPARCKVGKWSSASTAQQVLVVCHDAVDRPYDTGWTLTYERRRAVTGAANPPRNFAYTFDHDYTNPGPYVPAPAEINYNSQGAVNTVQSAGVGQRLVIFPAVGVRQTNVQVTAYGPDPYYCNLLVPWISSGSTTYVRNVVCYKGTSRVDQPSLVTHLSAY